jgi:hypothetical protein
MIKIRCRTAIWAMTLALMPAVAWTQKQSADSPASLSLTQIVGRMQQHDQMQAEALEHYHSLRHYEVEYQGFPKKVAAKMDVEVDYDASSGKSFRIISQSGSKALCEKVLKRALESEKEAAQKKALTALTEENYRFHLLGSEDVGGRPAYVLEVEPKTSSVFLFKGKIWVDEADFAVAKLEAQPSRNPSFWISRTLIHHTNAKRDGFWLPDKNRSETKVRIGGTAVMTIDYGTYQTVSRPLRPGNGY